jgi:hemerythrin
VLKKKDIEMKQAYEPELSISALMVSDHERLLGLFNDFKSCKDHERERVIKIFSRFRNELLNHFITEETIMKKSFTNKEGKENLLPIAASLKLEHKRIIDIVNEINEACKKGRKIDLSNLFLILRHHKNIEDRLFYPELDRVLSEKEKRIVFDSING